MKIGIVTKYGVVVYGCSDSTSRERDAPNKSKLPLGILLQVLNLEHKEENRDAHT